MTTESKPQTATEAMNTARAAAEQPIRCVADAWRRYSRVIPPRASDTQVRETRRAFYCGAFAMLHLSQDVASGAASASDADIAAAASRLKDINQELDRFMNTEILDALDRLAEGV